MHTYVICATPRTGSYLLCEALLGTGVAGRPTESLSPFYQEHWERRWGTTTYAEYLARLLETHMTPNGVFGTKLHPPQLDHVLCQMTGHACHEPPEVVRLLGRHLPNLRWVWTTRRDKLRQAISYTKALQTEVWWDTDEPPVPSEVPLPAPCPGAEHFSVEEIRTSGRRIAAWEQGWSEFFERAGVRPLVVAYEDLVRAYEATVLGVLDYLGLSLPPGARIAAPSSRRQADATTEIWERRYRSLEPGSDAERAE